MTDPEFADATYVEPLDVDMLMPRSSSGSGPTPCCPPSAARRPSTWPWSWSGRGAVGTPGTPELIGANAEAIATAEDREEFKVAMQGIGLSGAASPASPTPWTRPAAVVAGIGLPVVIRPAFILGGKGTGIATTPEEFERMAANGLAASPISEILIEQSIAGWKEYELEVMRDRADNCVIICSIENLDPMGVHTGDSITVAPAQTLTDVEYQLMRDAAFACIRRVGVETGGSNVQFALDPTNGDMVIIEMNPRVSRSSALASKATGFPIAKIAAKLAVGYTLDEIPNDITGATPASFEPAIDYVVTKVPRWAFEKFPGAAGVLGTSMQSVGEAMAIGRTFPESLQKALRSPRARPAGPGLRPGRGGARRPRRRRARRAGRHRHPRPALPARGGAAAGHRDRARWPSAPRSTRGSSTRSSPSSRSGPHLAEVGFGGDGPPILAPGQAARLLRRPARAGSGASTEAEVRAARLAAGVRRHLQDRRHLRRRVRGGARRTTTRPTRTRTRSVPSDREKVVILGSGPNRIGQGIEFDYCCVHATFALADAGFETVMVNCNPETVSTDYDTSDRLYFEPLTLEDVLNVIEAEQAVGHPPGRHRRPRRADAAQAGRARSPPGLRARHLARVDRPGRGPRALERPVRPPRDPAAGRRHGHHASRRRQAIVDRIGYPVLLRPSYVLGGRAMEIVYDDESLKRAMDELAGFGSLGREGGLSAERPVLIDRFLEDATEVDVDAIRDHTGDVVIGGVMEHVEEAGRALRRLRLRHPALLAVGRHGRRSSRTTPGPSPTRSTSSASSTCSTR